VHELRIGAHRDDVAAHPHEPPVLLCQSSELGGSNECEVGRVEEENRPALLTDLLLQAELSKVSFRGFVRGQLDVWHLPAKLQPIHGFRHGGPPW
jgi:hypothetical protein